MLYNPIRNKPIAQQKQIAEKQRKADLSRKKALEQSVEAKKQWIKTESDLMREKQMRDAAAQNDLVKKAYYKELQEKEEKLD